MHTLLDISKWQGLIDFDTLKASASAFPNSFLPVIVRVGFGQQTIDIRAHRNLSELKRVGLPVGMYWYAPEPVKKEHIKGIVDKLEDFAKIYKPEYPIFLDVEGKQLWNSKTSLLEPCREFIRLMTSRGMYPGLYGSDLQLYNSIDVNTVAPECNFSRWVARYSTTKPKHVWDIWQYSSAGTMPGINGSVDMNKCQKDYKKIIKERKLNFWTS